VALIKPPGHFCARYGTFASAARRASQVHGDRTRQELLSKVQNNPGAQSQIVLALVGPIRKRRDEVIGLRHAKIPV
jgi:hypothetical protein